MKDGCNDLTKQEFDVLIIGAGMFGACIAWSAALRGYSVAVIDKGDFANATSSNHYKFIHGGIRYLQHLDLLRLRESSVEKSALIRIAPHLAYPMPIIFPTYGYGRRSKALMRAAMLVYDALTLDRNRGIADPARHTPNGSVIGREQLLEMFPGTPSDELTGAALFYDGQMYNPARFVLAFLQSAASRGAVVVNYVGADRLVTSNKKVVGVEATDSLSGRKYDIRARTVVNAAGPWAHHLLADDSSLALEPRPSFSRDLAFVVDKSVHATHAIGCQSATSDSDAILDRGGRHLFLVPWRGMTLVGVWHKYSHAHPDEVPVSQHELKDFIDEINGTYSGIDLRLDDIRMINTGHILFGSESAQGSDKKHSFAKRCLVVDHARNGIEGLVTVIGARATVARATAERTMNLVQRKLGDRRVRTHTERETLHGGTFDNFERLVEEIRMRLPAESKHAARSIAHNYGSEYSSVLECASDAEHLLTIGRSDVIGAEAIHAVRHESAKTLEDVVLRRTELGSGGDPGDDAIRAAAQLVGAELGWDANETSRQLESVRTMLRQGGPWIFEDQLPRKESSAA